MPGMPPMAAAGVIWRACQTSQAQASAQASVSAAATIQRSRLSAPVRMGASLKVSDDAVRPEAEGGEVGVGRLEGERHWPRGARAAAGVLSLVVLETLRQNDANAVLGAGDRIDDRTDLGLEHARDPYVAAAALEVE